MSAVPEIRIRTCNARPPSPSGDYVFYWMIASRRARHNFGLQRAVEHAVLLGKPLLVLEALRADYRWASDRLHRFVLDGMADNARDFARTGALYHPYVEPARGAGKGLFEALARRAAVVVTDDYPAFFLPRMVSAAAARCPVAMEKVDSNGVLPMYAADKVFTTARSLRFFLQKRVRDHLPHFPAPNPLTTAAGKRLPPMTALPREIAGRWPAASPELLAGGAAALAALPIDHAVSVAPIRGGARAGAAALKSFLDDRLDRYADDRNHPDTDASSGLSPYLHFGHLSAHEVFARVTAHDGWTPKRLSSKVNGLREGFWGASEPVEAFLDELVTWREIGYNMCALRDDYDRFESLPAFALATLDKHRRDPRPVLYDRQALEAADTYDPVWNAAQRQLVREGRIHNYLRMLWGKKVLEWSRTPEEALDTLVELNNRYALDGRDPNSYSGIFWVFGRYDRAWGPERPIFGTVRYMSSESTAKKLKMRDYLARFGP